MQWVARKTMVVQDAQGVKRTVAQGEVVPEAKSWRNPSLWCLAVPDSQVAPAPAPAAPAAVTPQTSSAPAGDSDVAGGASTGGTGDSGNVGSPDEGASANPENGAAEASASGSSNKPMVIPSIDTLNKTDLMAHMTLVGVQFKATDDKATLWVKYQEFIAEQNKGEV